MIDVVRVHVSSPSKTVAKVTVEESPKLVGRLEHYTTILASGDLFAQYLVFSLHGQSPINEVFHDFLAVLEFRIETMNFRTCSGCCFEKLRMALLQL